MDEAIKQIGERLKGLREVLNIPAEEIAELCEISLDHYLKIESGEADPSVYRLSKISKRYGIDLDVLLFGEEPRMKGYYVTRKGQGPEIDRNNQYKYQSLAVGFKDRKVNPFMVQVDPLPGDKKPNKNGHDGQEYDYVIEGQLEVTIEEKVMVLNPGDSIYFDSKKSHCFRSLNNEPAKFLCIIILKRNYDRENSKKDKIHIRARLQGASGVYHTRRFQLCLRRDGRMGKDQTRPRGAALGK